MAAWDSVSHVSLILTQSTRTLPPYVGLKEIKMEVFINIWYHFQMAKLSGSGVMLHSQCDHP